MFYICFHFVSLISETALQSFPEGPDTWALDLYVPESVRRASQVALSVKNLTSAGDIRDMGSIPGLGRSSGGGRSSPLQYSGNPLQYSCLKNPMDRGAWQAI